MKHRISSDLKHKLVVFAHISIIIFVLIYAALGLHHKLSPLIFVYVWLTGIIILDARILIHKLDNEYCSITSNGRSEYTGRNIIKICPQCGYIVSQLPEEHEPCKFCTHPTLISTEYTYAFYWNNLPPEKAPEWKERLRMKYVLSSTNSQFSVMLYRKREEEEENKTTLTSSPKVSNPYACPRCGGTSFTPVRRNWSIWNGHRTNKIDMVCNKCGYVKKG